MSQELKSAGIVCNYVTGGGTGTFPYEAASGVFTEVQPVQLRKYGFKTSPVDWACRFQGSYIVMDADYGRNYGDDGRPYKDFVNSLFVMATVQSVNVCRADRLFNVVVYCNAPDASYVSGP